MRAEAMALEDAEADASEEQAEAMAAAEYQARISIPVSAGKQGKIALKERTQSPGRYLLSPNDDSFERRQARLARAAASQRRRSFAFADSLEDADTGSGATTEQAPGVLSNTQVLELLNNCLKLSAENKINQHNTWDLKLIDYLPDIVKADNGEGSQTNFQKASCTLEASAKIYSFRVDSVHSETYKVLGGLHRSAASGKEKNCNGDAVTAENAEGHDDEQDVRRKDAHRKPHDHSANLDSYESLNVKHFDVSLNVDPLFHQTSAQFDEGGAKGLLLNTLSVYRGCEILFDSCDVPEKCMKLDLPRDPPTIDLSFMADAIIQMRMSKKTEISPSLKDIVELLDDPLRAAAEAEGNTFEDEDPGSLFNNDIDEGDMEIGEVYDAGPDDYGQDGTFASSTFATPDSTTSNSPLQQSDEGDLGNGTVEDPPDDAVVGEYTVDWLREGMGIPSKKNFWAGPDYWKFIRPKGEIASELSEQVASKATKRKKKEPFSIVYTSIPPFDMALIAKPRNLRANLLPQRHSVSTTLPADLHYQADDLLRLFLRPSVMCIRGRQRKAGLSKSKGSAASPSQMIWDDGGNDGFQDWDGENSHSDIEDNGETLIARPRKVQKIEINYDKTSKQVDIRALKQSIWEHLQEASNTTRLQENEDEEDEGIHFRELFGRVPENCPAAAPEDVSVHLCFICLLHLANEHNLVIKDCSTMDELLIQNVQR